MEFLRTGFRGYFFYEEGMYYCCGIDRSYKGFVYNMKGVRTYVLVVIFLMKRYVPFLNLETGVNVAQEKRKEGL
jgi:hypothetical protein